MFCENCGKEILNKSKFCKFCGAKVKIESIKNDLIKLLFFASIISLVIYIVFLRTKNHPDTQEAKLNSIVNNSNKSHSSDFNTKDILNGLNEK